MKRKGASIEIEEIEKKKRSSEKSMNHRKRASSEIRDEEAPKKKKKIRSAKSIQFICCSNNEKLNHKKRAGIEIREDENFKEPNNHQLLYLSLLLLLANPEIPKKKRSISNRKKAQFCSSNENKSGKSTLEKQMDITVNQAMKVHFEEEILMDILSRLPVRSLLRFKCVSIFWRALISDPYFKMKHLRHAKNDENSQKLLIAELCPNDDMYSMYCCPLSSVPPVEDVRELDCPSSSRPWSCAIICCYDGLVFIVITDNKIDKRRILLLWNPSTGESTVLPDAEFPWTECRCGFGYDSTSGEYKIIKIQNRAGASKLPNEVLALKSGSWRQIDEPPRGILSAPYFTHSLAFVHEAFHWIGCFRDCSVLPSKYCVVSFSISNEVYAELPLPEQIYRGNQSVGISVLDGMLCVHSRCFSQSMYTCKVWILKDYGVEESWNALFTIQDPYICEIKPKYRFANGEVLFLCSQIRPGNVFRTSSGPFALWPHSGTLKCIAFTESLISPRSLSY